METRLREAGQEHLLEHMGHLPPERRAAFLRELEGIDWNRVRAMHLRAGSGAVGSSQEDLVPLRALEPGPKERSGLRESGLSMLASGRAAFVLMAGGQGSRLGYDGPKGAAPLGLPGDLTLFEVLVRRLLRLGALSGTLPPFSVMTGPDNDEATRRWFRERRGPALPPDWPSFFVQSSAPALDESGRALLEAPGRLALVPDGNGGIWERLRDAGLLSSWKARGIEWIHVAGVDNLLSLPCDPVFLGFAGRPDSLCPARPSCAPIPRRRSACTPGTPAGRPRVAEYTELPVRTARPWTPTDFPVHREANIASHLVRLDLAEPSPTWSFPGTSRKNGSPTWIPPPARTSPTRSPASTNGSSSTPSPASPGMSLLRVAGARVRPGEERRWTRFPRHRAKGPGDPPPVLARAMG
jgi:UDP-N-acetylglucosamine/UDP-N-acetylgalactosamine diphosphorylase